MSDPKQTQEAESAAEPNTSPETQGTTEAAQEPAANSEANPEQQIAELQSRLEAAEAAAQAAKESELRSIAELDNVRKRAERQTATAARYANEKILADLLGIADSLDLGLVAAEKPGADSQSLKEGMELTHKQMLSILEKHGVTPVNPKGEAFNPDLHEAVSMVPSADVAANHVLDVMQKGYRIHDRLLRPAMVIVASAPSG